MEMLDRDSCAGAKTGDEGSSESLRQQVTDELFESHEPCVESLVQVVSKSLSEEGNKEGSQQNYEEAQGELVEAHDIERELPVYERRWTALTEEQKAAAETAGYREQSWRVRNHANDVIKHLCWWELDTDVQCALEVLGHTGTLWDERVGLEEDSDEGEECPLWRLPSAGVWFGLRKPDEEVDDGLDEVQAEVEDDIAPENRLFTWEQLTTKGSITVEELNAKMFIFEGKEVPEAIEDRMREKAQEVAKRKANIEVDKFLGMMRKHGGGNITLAWRRHFDSDGDGELSFGEFCHALKELGYKGDLLQLWHDLTSRSSRADVITLEALDTAGAEILNGFADWCLHGAWVAKLLNGGRGGPMALFHTLDEDGSESLTVDEFAEGLTELGFFEHPNVPEAVSSEELVKDNLFPLLDQSGGGCVIAEQMLFLEPDRRIRKAQSKEMAYLREHGSAGQQLQPKTNDAAELLHEICMSSTAMGGKHWSLLKHGIAVGGPPSMSANGGRAAIGVRRSSSAPLGSSAAHARDAKFIAKRQPPAGAAASLRDLGPCGAGAQRAVPQEPASGPQKRTLSRLPLVTKGPSPHVLDHYKAWGTGGGRVDLGRRANLVDGEHRQTVRPGHPVASRGNIVTENLNRDICGAADLSNQPCDSRLCSERRKGSELPDKVRRQRQCYRQTHVPKTLPTLSSISASKPSAATLLSASASLGCLPRATRQKLGVPRFNSANLDHWSTSKTQGELFERYAPTA